LAGPLQWRGGTFKNTSVLHLHKMLPTATTHCHLTLRSGHLHVLAEHYDTSLQSDVHFDIWPLVRTSPRVWSSFKTATAQSIIWKHPTCHHADTPSHAYTLYPINGSVRLFARIMTVREMAPIQQKVIALTEACLLAFGTTCPGLSTVSISTFFLLSSWPGT
jgi:hypothetical protein